LLYNLQSPVNFKSSTKDFKQENIFKFRMKQQGVQYEPYQ